MADKPEEVVVEETPTPEVVDTVKAPTKEELLRELSKELGVNAFEPKEVKAKFDEFNAWKDSQKTEQQKLQEKLQAYEAEKSAWDKQRLEYESKLKATQLGIKEDNLGDVLKLADNDPEKIADIVKKYPMFKSKDGVKIGLQDPANSKRPTDMSDAEAYMAKDPLYSKWNKK